MNRPTIITLAWLLTSATALFAQTDDIAGCTDESAFNYNPEATTDDGSCLGTGCPDPEALNFDVFTIFFGTGNLDACLYEEDLVYGCTDESADNFDPEANSNDGTCVYSYLPGCTDPEAWNFNPAATEDDGSCQIPGCPDPAATNYDPFSVFYGGTNDLSMCEYPDPVPGCTDASAVNYNPLANVSDGSCEYLEVSGCTDESALNYNPWATEDNGTCFGLGSGAACGDPTALNFNPFFFLVDPTGLDDSACEYGDPVVPEVVLGCTDTTAANFNPMATIDNGSCLYVELGCTNPMALNYDPLAAMDDGTCMFPDDVMEAPEWSGLEAELIAENAATGMNTYRLYATFSDPDAELVTVFGDANQPLEIAPLEGNFYQAATGATFADDLPSVDPTGEVNADTWLTIGLGDDLTFVGPDLSAFDPAGQTLLINSPVGGAWFRIPGLGDAGTPDAAGRVLLGQFTHAGAAQALLNLQYFDAEGMPHQVHGATLTWPSTDDDSTNGDDLDDSPAGCSGDLDSDGLVSVNDLLELISQFGNLCE